MRGFLAFPLWIAAWLFGMLALACLRVIGWIYPEINPNHIILHRLRYRRVEEVVTVEKDGSDTERLILR